jgi:ferredoxin
MMFSGLLCAREVMDTLPISASGGCQSWQDIVETILYGATAVSIHTLFMRKGFGVIPSLKVGILEFMKKKGFSDIKEMRGIISQKVLTEEECFKIYGSSKGKLIVSLDEEKCNGCGICKDTCFFYAITMKAGIPEIHRGQCEQCRLCICNCPTGALKLHGIPLLRDVARQ